MSELKAYIVYTPREGVVEGLWKSYAIRIEGVEVYLKSEADKVIAELEENHKKEVGQLLMKIAELKETLNNSRNARKYWRKEYLIEYKECCNQKYKRGLAMAKICENKLGTIVKPGWWYKWSNRWLKIAEQFKDKEATK